MHIKLEISTETLQDLIKDYLRSQVNFPVNVEDIKIQVKLDRGGSEWVSGRFRAILEKAVLT